MSARPQPRVVLPCRCGAVRFHRIEPVREHGRDGVPVALAVAWLPRRRELGRLARAVSCVGPNLEASPFGSYTVVVCASCGDTRWYATLTPELEAELPSATLGACACGEQRALCVRAAQTRGAGGLPSPLRVAHWSTRRWGFSSSMSGGSFSTFVCRGCGLTRWVADALEGLPLRVSSAPPCDRCAHEQRHVVDPVNEDGATLRVLYDRLHERDVKVGSYALSICVGCGTTEWTARELDALSLGGHYGALGVTELAAVDGSEGPYR